MIIASGTKVQSNITDDAFAMTFDTSGVKHIMGILSNMYTDKYLAIVREYASNALDAHREVGNTEPVLITLPNEWEPNFKVRDFGPGLDRDGLINTFGVYGKSTKRESNAFIGALGIGSKSAFTVASQFVVTGIKGGVRTVALFALSEDSEPTVSILSTTDVDAPNGVEVSIAVTDIDGVHDASQRLFKFWDEGTVLVDGEQPVSVWGSMLRVTDNVFASEGTTYAPSLTVVMGGTGYAVDHNLLYRMMYNGVSQRDKEENEDYIKRKQVVKKIAQRLYESKIEIIGKVPLGSVDIAPSREGLRDTEQTKQTLADIMVEYAENITDLISAEIDAATTAMDAVIKLKDFKPFMQDLEDGVDWHGQRLNYRNELKVPYVNIGSGRNGHDMGVINDSVIVTLASNFDNYVVITGVTPETAGAVRRSAKRFVNDAVSKNAVGMICVEAAQGSEGWFSWGGDSPVWTISIEEFRALVKTISTVTYGSAGPTTYWVQGDGVNGYLTAKQIADLDGRIVLMDGWSNNILGEEVKEDDDFRVKLSGRQSEEVFGRKVKFTRLTDLVKTKAEEIVTAITPAEMNVLQFRTNNTAEGLVRIMKAVGDYDLFGQEMRDYYNARQATQVFTKDEQHRLTTALTMVKGHYWAQNNGGVDMSTVTDGILNKYPLIYRAVSTNYYSPMGETEVKHAGLYVQAVLQS
jgi:hypothetical protein